MDVAILANLFLFLAALGINLAGGGEDDTEAEAEPLYNAADYAGRVDGTAADDTASAEADNQAWFLYGGDDSLTGSDGADYAELGDGDDGAAMGAGNDIVVAGDGDDTAAGGAGDDRLFGDAGNDSLSGDAGNDALAGGSGDDSLWGLDGADTLAGGDGADLLLGGDDADLLFGGAGDDTLSGFAVGASGEASLTAIDGVDSLSGGDGNDLLILGRGDIAIGGAGDDRFVLDLRWADGTEVATIDDYAFASDQIELHYTPRFDSSGAEIPPNVTVAQAEDGSFSVIQLNGESVARVNGSHAVGVGEVVLVRAP